MKYQILAFLFCSVSAFAQVNQPNIEGASKVNEGDPTKSKSINQSADTARSSQGKSAMLNQMAGFAFQGIFQAGCRPPDSQWGCYAGPLAALALMQAAHTGSAAGMSGASFDGSYDYKPIDSGTGPGGDGTSVAGADPSGTGGFTDKKKIQAALAELKGAGYSVDPKTGDVTTPKGTFPAKSFSSAAGMASAGMSAADIKAAGKTIEDINARIAAGGSPPTVSGMPIDASGGAAGYGGAGAGYKSSLENYFSSLNKSPNEQEKNRWLAGKSMTLGGEPIGVNVDNIFTMVHRRYQEKRKIRMFLEKSL